MNFIVPITKGPSLVHVVDDDSGIRTALDWVLTNAGHSVRLHESGRGFLGALELRESGCVITDMRMPGMSGLDLLAAMKMLDIALPVIVMTAYGEVPLAVAAMKLGAVDFLEKPFETAVVIAAVGWALGGPVRRRPRMAGIRASG